ncbi:hypothetical protein L915_01832, partial [Phytophthora nicotianae]
TKTLKGNGSHATFALSNSLKVQFPLQHVASSSQKQFAISQKKMA